MVPSFSFFFLLFSLSPSFLPFFLLFLPPWRSYVPDESKLPVANALNDYHSIRLMNPHTGVPELLCVENTVQWFKEEYAWLKEQVNISFILCFFFFYLLILFQVALAKQNGERVAIFTHHAPSINGTSHPRYHLPLPFPLSFPFPSPSPAIFFAFFSPLVSYLMYIF